MKTISGFSKYIITDLLRETYGYDGVVCSDWRITEDVESVDMFQGKSWGVETMSVTERTIRPLKQASINSAESMR